MWDFLKKMLPSKQATSPAGTVNSIDIAKFLRDGAIVGVISALGYYGAHLSDVMAGLGEAATAVTTIVGMGISLVIRKLNDASHPPTTDVKKAKE